MYLDNELPDEQVSGIQAHLGECVKCKRLLEDAQESRSELNAFLSKLHEGESSISIPPFDPGIKRDRLWKTNPISLLWKVAAGIALLIGFFWITQKRSSSQEFSIDQAEMLLLELMGDVEPNQAWHEGQMGIIIFDEDGDLLQSFITNEIE